MAPSFLIHSVGPPSSSSQGEDPADVFLAPPTFSAAPRAAAGSEAPPAAEFDAGAAAVSAGGTVVPGTAAVAMAEADWVYSAGPGAMGAWSGAARWMCSKERTWAKKTPSLADSGASSGT